MAQTGYTPIQLYYSATTTNVPTAGNLAAGELAINTADGKLFYKDSSNVVQVIATKAGANGDAVLANNNAFTGANTFYNATGQTFGTATSTNDGIIIKGRAGGSSSYRVSLAPTTLSASRTVTLPDADTTVPVATQVITFSGPTAARTVTLPDTNTTVPISTQQLTFSGPSAARTYTLPDSASTLAALATAQTFTALQTFSGSTSVAAAKLTNAKEVATVSATAATGTIAYDVTTQSVLYYTTNASANWTVNFRGSSGTSLDALMSTGESITVAFLVTQGATPYYNSAVQVDGNAVTPKYQGGTAWTAGNASSIDAYTYTIVKTGSAAFTVFAAQTQFK